MEQKKDSRLGMFEELCKQFSKLVLEMDAVRLFKKHCEDPETDEVLLQNPVNCLGHLHLKPEEVMPFIDAEMQKKQERARQLADRIKSLLDEGNYEQWNLLEDGLTVADFIDKGIHTTFDREPGGLVEQFERMKERDNAELSPTPSWQWEKGMLQTADILSSKKAEYLVLRWAQMVNASVLEVKDEWLRRFGDAQSEEDRTAKEMLERYVAMAEEHMNKLFSLADEYSKKRCTSVGQQSGTVWHPKTERPDDESQILIDEGDGCGTAGEYYADGDMLAAAADGIAADWEDWHMDRWAYISDLVPKKEKEDGV